MSPSLGTLEYHGEVDGQDPTAVIPSLGTLEYHGKVMPFSLASFSTALHLKFFLLEKVIRIKVLASVFFHTYDLMPMVGPPRSTAQLGWSKRKLKLGPTEPHLVPSGTNLPSLMFRSKPQSSRRGLEKRSQE